MSVFNFKKAVQALNYISTLHGGSVTGIMALKLIWLADRLHLRRHGRMITNDTYIAMPRGPVASKIYSLVKLDKPYLDPDFFAYAQQYLKLFNDSTRSYTSVTPVDSKVFSKSDINAIDDVYNYFGKTGRFELSEISHLFPEWAKHQPKLVSGTGRAFTMLLSDFFTPASKENEFDLFNQDPEALECASDAFFEYHSMA